MTILTCAEVRQLAFEIARDNPRSDRNESYHRHVTRGWMQARGGAEIGTLAAWNAGWNRGFHAFYDAQRAASTES